MSQENVETLRAMMAAFNRRDFEDGVRYVDPEVELHPGLTELDVKSRYRGRDEFRRFAETITDAWETYVVEPEEVIEVPDGRVLAVERWRARGRQGISSTSCSWTSTRFETVSSSESTASGIGRQPSKPWGCGSKGCRRQAVWSRLLLRMDRNSQLVAAAFHSCRSGTASQRAPPGACPSSIPVIGCSPPPRRSQPREGAPHPVCSAQGRRVRWNATVCSV
jgi:hypothetical protein